MTLRLFDPLDPPPDAWPEPCETRAYIEGIARAGVTAMIPNVTTRWLALRSGERVFPVTVNDGAIGGSYVTLPHSAYILYARAELDLVDTGRLRPVLAVLIGIADRLIRRARINRIVHVDNWLLSTNLHGDWDGADVAAIRTFLVGHFPDHAIAIRSVDGWSSPALLKATARDGWTMLASRQIWVTTDLARQWEPRRDTRADSALLAASGLTIDHFETMSEADSARIAALYHLLYVGKYSPLNPVFSPAYVHMTWREKILHYRGVREADGTILAIAGSLIRGDVLTPPVVGYDTARPQAEGLYRIATLLFTTVAMETGTRLNGSAGAAHFKRNRGATGVIEYMAIATAHLPWGRRAVFGFMRLILDRIAVPMMKKRGL
ncbi:GNAT family N-acetyltransferase [Sphingomonas sp. So64.6b]|uniref:GNAT family N-acetyltransferase n=1 Tax=Sphingomonas sp. So64.6b TaxID=2997354 RepID=UPI0016047943|nr:GNAT family N-acetyltransferase [Sphingomonas sp. So64.6b]QNA83828.1 GNAT family N-acetyltransferase [Sphingomonas sp. So64.6b]